MAGYFTSKKGSRSKGEEEGKKEEEEEDKEDREAGEEKFVFFNVAMISRG